MPDSERHPARRHTGGLVIVVGLGVIFFVLLVLLVLSGGRKTTTDSSQTNETLTVLPPTIRIRTQPNAKAPVVATAHSGETLEKVEDRGMWVRVKTGDGLEGWAERSTLERTAERERRVAHLEAIRKLPPLAGVVKQRTALYAGPGIFYPIVGELDDAASVQVYTRDHDFYAVGVGDTIAYADIDAINVTAGGPQLAVTPHAAAANTETTPSESPAPTPPSQAETAEPNESTIAPPTPPVEAAPRNGVYAAVPAGGTQPEEINRVIPRYPMGARSANVEGPVVIRGIVRRDGTIDNVEIIRDLPYGLGEAAREAVQQWRFRPATYRGEPIDVFYTVTVNFRLR